MSSAKYPPIIGLGNDIIEIDRIRKSFETHSVRMLPKLFTPKEQEACLKHKDPVPHLAGRFAAKEAIVKALGTGFGAHAAWLDFEIINDAHGKPCVHLSATMEEKLQGTTLLVSISHCERYATACALWVRSEAGADSAS